MKKFSKSSLFLDAFNSKVRDSTRISGQVGNAYTGSIYSAWQASWRQAS
jgi:3-hydroxy-3-methylglutaryl CoA synthase